MKRLRFFFILLLISSLILCSSCALYRESLDKKSGFSTLLKTTEDNIRQEDWLNARENLQASHETWKSLKPIMQIDIDHDYVNNIENNFVVLEAYLENQEKTLSLATILLIQYDWEHIGEM